MFRREDKDVLKRDALLSFWVDDGGDIFKSIRGEATASIKQNPNLNQNCVVVAPNGATKITVF